MTEPEDQDQAVDAANNEVGPTEKLSDEAKSDAGEMVPGEQGVPGAQNPASEEIKDEQGPNTE